jgi:hypothetical protein
VFYFVFFFVLFCFVLIWNGTLLRWYLSL